MQAVACLSSVRRSSASLDQESGHAAMSLDELPVGGDGVATPPPVWDAGLSHIDKVTLASKMTQDNHKSRVEFMRFAYASQGLEIVAGRIRAVRTAEEVKHLMEGSCVSA